MNFRIVDIYIDAVNSERIELDGERFKKPERLTFYATQQLLLRFHLLSSPTTYFSVNNNSVWYFGIDTEYTYNHEDIVQVGNDSFIATDWNEADFANGKVCCRVDLTGESFLEALSGKSEITGYAGLWCTVLGEKPLCVVEFEVKLKNVATYQITPTQQEGVVYVTTDMLTGYMRKIEPYHNTWWKNGLLHLYCSDDQKWYPIGLRIENGVPAMVIVSEGKTTEEMEA